jgi:hypothetical protein
MPPRFLYFDHEPENSLAQIGKSWKLVGESMTLTSVRGCQFSPSRNFRCVECPEYHPGPEHQSPHERRDILIRL